MCHNSPRGDLYYRNHLAKEHPELGYERVVEQPRKRKASTDGLGTEVAEYKIANRKIGILEARLAAKDRMEQDTKKWHEETLGDMRQQLMSAELRHQQELEELRRQMQAENRRLHEQMDELRHQNMRSLERTSQEIDALRRDKELAERQLEAELERADAMDEPLFCGLTTDRHPS